ncbi:MAG: cobaltochelatase subunit CobN, partial [Oscillospiraceae bacterium]|nr:cobaltochelatase subunit CobN [Oscillospiraceae bacterium]
DEDEKLGIRGAMERYFTREGRSLPDVILVLTGFALTHMGWPGDGVREVPDSIFSFYDVPAIQVMLTRFTPEDYETLPQGIDSLSLTSHVFQPETDGQIISVPNAAQAAETGPAGERKLFVPLPDRVERVCRLAMNWAKLRRTAAGEKRIAILFNTMPGNDRIGCAEGLDTFESVLRIVEALRDEGVETDFSFETAQALADAVTAGLTNDLRWTSEEAMEEKAAAVIPPETWRSWFGPLSERVREALSGAWGRAPGEVMALDDRLLIPGLLCGHIFIGLQPSRAFGERASELYHSTDSTPPYSYLAYYRWLEECFGADCVVHVGTHGTLEWTPGKEVGLSRDCWPDLCLGSLPHLYPYHMGIVGEGIQAKRRSWAVILDHMPPSLDEAESYEGLAVIDEALKEYHQARQVRPAQAPALARRIFDLAAGERLTLDLGLDEKGFEADPDGAVEAIHLWMGELKNSLVKDGLHVFGQVPEGKLYENLLRALVRVKNGGVPALTDSVIAALGHDPEAVKDAPAADFGGVSGLELRDMATAAARRLVSALAERGWDPAAIGAVLEREAFPGGTADLRRVLEFLCTVVTDKLDHVTDEMRYFLAGFAGRFVPPALGGNP